MDDNAKLDAKSQNNQWWFTSETNKQDIVQGNQNDWKGT